MVSVTPLPCMGNLGRMPECVDSVDERGAMPTHMAKSQLQMTVYLIPA